MCTIFLKAPLHACVERSPELQDAKHQRPRDHFERYYARRKLGFTRVG